ncbi:UNVERIFIED_CONTAM: hypothetical protein GTU68_028707 [Idotea baltica]|nr:hypothetical protein [Idotea baltica]
MTNQTIPIDILLVEDDPSDVLLLRKALKESNIFSTLSVARDGLDALNFLKRSSGHEDARRPDLIFLDLNMPRMDGREFLQAMKLDPSFRGIPVIVLTTSDADKDVCASYNLQASCYVTKPAKLDQFKVVLQSIKDFWLSVVKYPER